MEQVILAKGLAFGCVLLALLCVFLYTHKKVGGWNKKNLFQLDVKGQLLLGPKERLVVVRYHNDELLLALSDKGIQNLATHALEAEPALKHDRLRLKQGLSLQESRQA
jgi:flagellar biogenesis protein FliO